MKNQAIRDKYAALTILSQRALPSKTAINKVATLLTRFQPPYEVTETARKIALNSFPLPDGFEGVGEHEIPLAIREARTTAVEALMEESQSVKKIPTAMRLTSADMPKVLKREKGEDNAVMLAQIRRMLGTLYLPAVDEVIADNEEGEEPDELQLTAAASDAPADEFAPAHAEDS
jgi:hypothetical protein